MSSTSEMFMPCIICSKDSENGLQCDDCNGWWCLACLDKEQPNCLPPKLYKALTDLENFAWSCPSCSQEPLGQQVVSQKQLTPRQLATLGYTEVAKVSQVNSLDRAIEKVKQESIAPEVEVTNHSANQKVPSVTKVEGSTGVRDKVYPERNAPGFQGNTGPQGSVAMRELGQSSEVVSAISQSNDIMSVMQMMFIHLKEERQEERKERQKEFQLLLDSVKQQAQSTPVLALSSSPQSANAFPSAAKLPKVKLPTFSGIMLEWPNFWESFEVNVHSQLQLRTKQKLDYLHQCLTGTAKDKIKGLGLQGDKYEEAIRILQDHYGNPQYQQRALWENLRTLAPVKESLVNLEKFTDDLRACTVSLQRQGTIKETLDSHVEEVKTKLPSKLLEKLTEMRLYQGKKRDPLTMEDLIIFLTDYQEISLCSGKIKKESVPSCQMLQQADKAVKSSSASFTKVPPKKNATKGKRWPCLFCDQQAHYSSDCSVLKTPEKRREVLIKKKRCTRCLAEKHEGECHRLRPCYHCKAEDHHSVLCTKRTLQQGLITVSEPPPEDSTAQQQSYLTAPQATSGIVMASFPCKVTNPLTQESRELNVYLDGGAKLTCINADTAAELGLPGSKSLILETSRFNTNQVEKVPCQVVKFTLNGPQGFRLDVQGYSISKMAPPLKVEPLRLPNEAMKKLQRLKPLNQPSQGTVTKPIDVLVGQDYLNIIMGPRTKATNITGDLFVHHTPLGKVLCGNAQLRNSEENHMFSPALFCTSTLEDKVEQMWKLEAIGIAEENSYLKDKNEQVMRDFRETVTQGEDGRFEVGLPWKEKNPTISSNFRVAKSRLSSTLKTLAPEGKPTKNLETYNEIFQDQLKKGVIELVTKKEPDGPVVHYIAHFPVIREDKATTKVRIVYDASVATKLEKKSLNQLLHAGPCMLNDLVGILLRFRCSRIVITADIEKAFLQVGLKVCDRDSSRFLWLKDVTNLDLENNLQVYRFARIPFGFICSPFLLGGAVLVHLENFADDLSNMILRNLYVDNVILQTDDPSDSFKLYQESKKRFSLAQMNLREYQSNDQSLMKQIPALDKAKGEEAKVLGLGWNISTDQMYLKATIKPLSSCTRRGMLKQIATVFDPLGFAVPVMIRGRILLQETWKLQLEWDEPLTDKDIILNWQTFEQEMLQLPSLQWPRYLGFNKKDRVQLLCFCDASPLAYGTCIYLRQESKSKTHLKFIMSRARVAPLKPKMTLPQLELTAVLIGARAMKFIQTQLDYNTTERYLWTDSQIVLQWLHSDKALPAYVDRRCQEIQSVGETSFGHVRSEENPADFTTRGVATKRLQESLWLQGPQWLLNEPSLWPRWDVASQGTESSSVVLQGDTGFLVPHRSRYKPNITPKSNTESCVNLVTQGEPQESPDPPYGIKAENFSTWRRLLRVSAYCTRFIESLKGRMPPETRSITTIERQDAEKRWLRYLQESHFAKELALLHKGKSNQVIKQLDLQLHEGIMRCGGRLANAALGDATHPVLIPPKHPVTQLLIEDAHRQSLHLGIRSTLAKLRTRYWPPHGYTRVRKVLAGCLICRKVQGEAFRPPAMGQLPKERVTRAPAFKFTGLDYMGPILVREKVGDEHVKRWVALFTCFTTRAIHLEVVSECSTDAATKAILRFIGRRGTPDTLLSDNASQFKKCGQALHSLWGESIEQEDIEHLTSFFSNRGIKWRYIPERSPWVGGFYERLIGVVKRCLRKAFWKLTVDTESLSTILIEVEGVINSRPLLAPSSDIGEQRVLTPAHFIAPNSQLCVPPNGEDPKDPDYLPDPTVRDSLLGQWRKLERKLDQFWKVWQSEYLQQLREAHGVDFRHRKGAIPREPKVGEVCLVRDQTPRNTWKKGLITELLMGNDNRIRFAKLRLPSGTLTKRGIQDLIPLEADFCHNQPIPQLAAHIGPPDFVVYTDNGNAETQILQSPDPAKG